MPHRLDHLSAVFLTSARRPGDQIAEFSAVLVADTKADPCPGRRRKSELAGKA
jgi:hypothetical protein